MDADRPPVKIASGGQRARYINNPTLWTPSSFTGMFKRMLRQTFCWGFKRLLYQLLNSPFKGFVPTFLKMLMSLARQKYFALEGGDCVFHAAPHPAPATKAVPGSAPL
ncbi:MAG: hypothetical protein V3S64_08500, partial [bacterium]